MNKTKLPVVSVIMPTYNVETYLKKSIESVLQQTFTDFELIIVIDQSPDNSKKVAATFVDERIKIFKKPHGGLSDTRNFGLEKASGKYIYFMDPDDWIDPGLLKENIELMENENLNFIVFGFIQEGEDEKGITIWKRKVRQRVEAFIRHDHSRKIDGHHLDLFGYAWNKIYRKTFLDKHQFRFLKGISLVEDILFNLPVFSASDIIRFNPKCYYHYINRNRKSLLRRYRKNSFELIKRKTEALANFADQWALPYKNELLSNSIIHGINYCIYNIYLCQNPLNYRQRKTLVRKIIYDRQTAGLIRHYRPSEFKDRLYKNNIQHKRIHKVTRMALGREL